MKISVKECADILREKDNILILTHANPDGDTLGSGFALCRALMKIGKICAVINADDIPKKYNYLFDDIVEIKFKPDYVVAVDVVAHGWSKLLILFKHKYQSLKSAEAHIIES